MRQLESKLMMVIGIPVIIKIMVIAVPISIKITDTNNNYIITKITILKLSFLLIYQAYR